MLQYCPESAVKYPPSNLSGSLTTLNSFQVQ